MKQIANRVNYLTRKADRMLLEAKHEKHLTSLLGGGVLFSEKESEAYMILAEVKKLKRLQRKLKRERR